MDQANTPVPKIDAVAGYVSPYPYLERLQEKMEERLAKRVPVGGRFCGFCFGRLRETETTCSFCERPVAQSGATSEIPQDVLQAYQARAKTEARWVHLGAFFGLIVASALFIVLVLWGPGILGHPAVGFSVLIFGGYGLAQLCGPLLGAQIGYRRGSRRRDALWAAWLASQRSSQP